MIEKNKPCIDYFEIGPYPVYFGFTTDPEKFKKEMKRLKVPIIPDFVNKGKHGATHIFSDNNDNITFIVTIVIKEKNSISEICGLLVHEAVHVWQGILETIGDNQASPEIEAYNIQNISQCMITKTIKKGLLNNRKK